MERDPLTMTRDAPLGRAVEAMRDRRATCLLATEADGRLCGILTEQDVVRRAAFRLPADTPLAAAMTLPVRGVEPTDYLYRAVGRMRRFGHRHMPVIDSAGRPIGLLSLDRALGAASERMMVQVDRLTQDSSAEGLAAAKQAQADFAWELLESGTEPVAILAVMSEINRDLHRRALALAMQAMRDDGRGAAPVSCTLLIMGSGGRRESFLRPDQDNGFILADYDDAAHGEIDGWFSELAGRFTIILDRIGFPLCKGNVMATNPLWRKTLPQWQQQVALWAVRRSPAAILNADIFLDFDGADGPPGPAAILRDTVLRQIGGNAAFLGAMAAEEARITVALGWFGRIAVERSGSAQGRADLKLHGLIPLVAAVRKYALREGVAALGTLDRIAALQDKGTFGGDEADRLADAFRLLAGLLLRQQLTDHRAGREAGNFVDPQSLPQRQREHLVEALRSIDLVSRRARADFTGQAL